MRRAAFLDRDGTIVHDTGFVRDPATVALIDGAATALTRLRASGVLIVVVTNQSGIGRGLFDWNGYRAVEARIDALLEADGAAIDATYVCPHYPPVSGPCECRKPGLDLSRAAIGRFGIDPTRSVWVGDRLSDLEPARSLGGLGLLVETGAGVANAEAARQAGFEVVSDLGAAVERFLGEA